jgi:hypothetical protein
MPRILAACSRIESLSLLICDENYRCITDIVHSARALRSLAMYGKLHNNRGLPCIELPETFVNNLQALALDYFDFYNGNEQDSFTFVRQCTNLTVLDIRQPRTVKVWNEQLFQFLPKLKAVKGLMSMNPTSELIEEPVMKETPEPIPCLETPRVYPMSAIFSNIVSINLCDAHQSQHFSDHPLESVRYLLCSCPQLAHLGMPERRLTKKMAKHMCMRLFSLVFFFCVISFDYGYYSPFSRSSLD